MRIVWAVLLSVVMCGVAFWVWRHMQKEHWAVYYGSSLPAETFSRFDVLVFDSQLHPPVAQLKADGKIVLGYLSLGEADPHRDYYHVFMQKHLLLPDDPAIMGHNVIDIRKPAWGQYVLDTMIPSILAQGYDGIMIDTLDNVIQPQLTAPQKYPGMIKASVELIKAIRARYPHIRIMVNRGFELLPFIAGDIDMELAESLYTNVLPGDQHVIRPPQEYQPYMNILKSAQQQYPSLKIYSLDYWPPSDKEGVERLYKDERNFGFIPYVSTMDLQSVYPEP